MHFTDILLLEIDQLLVRILVKHIIYSGKAIFTFLELSCHVKAKAAEEKFAFVDRSKEYRLCYVICIFGTNAVSCSS